MKRFYVGALTLCSAFCLSSLAVAASINHGDFEGLTVHFLGVTEASNTGDTLPLFGAPNDPGGTSDTLDFDPIGFSANSAGGAGAKITDGQLQFMIQAKPGKAITTLIFTEAGDTTLAGIGTNATFTSVSADIFIDILEIDGVAINSVNVSAAMLFTPHPNVNGDAFHGLGTQGGGGPLFQTAWSGSAIVDLGAEVSGNITKVSVNLDNTLVANSENGTSAFVAKKDFDGLSITVDEFVIPEPATAMIGFVALAGLLGARRRGC